MTKLQEIGRNLTPKKLFFLVLKVAVFIGLAYLMGKQIFGRNDFEQIKNTFVEQINGFAILGLFGVLTMMLLNWGIEAFKWRLLIAKIEQLSLWDAFKAIWLGVSLSFFTPNRVGEYGGRVLILRKADKIQAVAITLVGSISQLIANVTLGILGFAAFNYYYQAFPSGITSLLIVCTFFSLFLLTLLYFNLKWIDWLKKYFSWFERLGKYTAPLKSFTREELTHIQALSFLRTMVFSLQYIALIWIFGIEASLFVAWIMVTSIFLVQTIVPSVALIELGVRGNVALFFWKFVTTNHLAILAATFSVWFINLVVPAAIGLIILFRLKNFGFKK